MPSLVEAATLILQSDLPVISVRDWLERYIENTEHVPATVAAERAERRLREFIALVRSSINQARVNGVPPAYEWSTDVEGDLERIGAFTEEGQMLDRVVRDRTTLLSCLRTLDPFLFERVGGFLLSIYGVRGDRWQVTQRSNDGGFDFYGIEDPDVVTPLLETPNRLRRVRYRLLGQAKRYVGKNVDHDDMDAFAWRLAMVRAGAGRRYEIFESWFAEDVDLPIAGMFITTSSFSNGARATAVSAHVILIDGEQIAHDLAASAWSNSWRDTAGEMSCEAFVGFFSDQYLSSSDAI
jgi:hypothetical protein